MKKYLLIVESPTKTKTISKFLNKRVDEKWYVLATGGHIKELTNTKHGIEFIGNEVKASWVGTEGFKKFKSVALDIIDRVDGIYIGTDDDREGERIAHDVWECLGKPDYKRIYFTEISEDAVFESIDNYRYIKNPTVQVAKTRRYIDREGGWGATKLLKYWLRKNQIMHPNNIGVGRAISPALHILNENQEEQDRFEKREYLQIKVVYQEGGVQFQTIGKTKYFKDEPSAMDQLDLVLRNISTSPHVVSNYNKKSIQKHSPEPLRTSTLQSSAFYLYGLRGKETMRIAQKLFESGYITYIRTDSNFISDLAYHKMLIYLNEHYQFPEDVLQVKRKYSPRKNAQNSHEAIRVVNFAPEYEPENIMKLWEDREEGFINTDSQNFKNVYELIWYRTIATQLTPAVYDDTEAHIDAGGNILEVKSYNVFELDEKGEKLKGWLKLKEGLLSASLTNENEFFRTVEERVPPLTVDSRLVPIEISLRESSTRAPYPYGEGRFIQKLESLKIARPSTLANIIPSLIEKRLIENKGQLIVITRLGSIVDKWCTEFAPWLNEVEDALKFEEKLESLEEEDDEAIIQEMAFFYHEKILELEEKIGFVELENEPPSTNQLELVKNIITKNGGFFDESLFATRKDVDEYLKGHMKKNKWETLGNCPSCKKGKIRNYENAYGCERKKDGCKFYMQKSFIIDNFERKGIIVDDKYINTLVINCLKDKKGVLIQNLRKQNGVDTYNAYATISKNKKGYWGINFGFLNNNEREEIAEGIIKDEVSIEQSSTIKASIVEDIQNSILEERVDNSSIAVSVANGFNVKGTSGKDEYFSIIKKLRSVNDEHCSNFVAVSIELDLYDEIFKTHGSNVAHKYLNHFVEIYQKLSGGKSNIFWDEGGSLLGLSRPKEQSLLLRFVKNLKREVEQVPLLNDENKISSSISVGVASFKVGLDSVDSVVKRAKELKEKAIAEGGNKIVFENEYDKGISA